MIRSRTLANDQSSSQTININTLTYSILNQLKNGLDTKTFTNVVLDQATIGANTAGSGAFTSLMASSNVVFKGSDGSSFTWSADGSLIALTQGTVIKWSDGNGITSNSGQLNMNDNIPFIGNNAVQQTSDNGIYLNNAKVFIGSGNAVNQASVDAASFIGSKLIQIKLSPSVVQQALPNKLATSTQLGHLELNRLFPTTVCHSYEKIDCKGGPVDAITKQPYIINTDVQFTKLYNISSVTNTMMTMANGYSDGQLKTISCLTTEAQNNIPIDSMMSTSSPHVIIKGQFWVNHGAATTYALNPLGSSVTFNYDTTLNAWFVMSTGGSAK